MAGHSSGGAVDVESGLSRIADVKFPRSTTPSPSSASSLVRVGVRDSER